MKLNNFVFLLLNILILINLCEPNKFNKFFEHIRSKQSAEIQKSAVNDLISRLIPNLSNKFIIEINFNLPNNYFIISKLNSSTNVNITASDGVSAARGFHYYLKYYLNSHISWDGNNLENIPNEFPSIYYESQSKNRFIYYQNVCTFSYSFAWWTWDNWRNHLDWMAMQGINIFLAPVQEEIWTRIYKKFNLTNEEINEHIAGPGFLAWQRMGNIRGWGGPLSDNFKNYTLNLQKQIINAARDLGMVIALPGFAGHLPQAFKRIFTNTTFSLTNTWNHFESKYCCPLFLDPTNPLFKQIGKMLIIELTKEYGTDHIYFSDPFNEMNPIISSEDYVRNVSQEIYTAMKSADDKAIWLLQGWMFIKNGFWDEKLIKAFLTANEIGTMLILDLQSEQNPTFEKTNFYYGHPFIWCMLHNFGGTLGLLGSIDILNHSPIQTKDSHNNTMVGFGITPEGIYQNYFIYEFALEMGWMMETQNLDSWITSYIKSRYGKNNQNLKSAWMIMLNGIYNYTGTQNMRGKYTFNRRPSLKIAPWVWYNTTDLKYVWKSFLDNSEDYKENKLFQHDLIDISRQNLQILTEKYYLAIKKRFNKKNLNKLIELKNDFLQLLSNINDILNTSNDFHLGKWLNMSRELAITCNDDENIDLYEKNLLYQITLWGPNGEITDYANKQWAGIVDKFFIPRWEIFFNELEKSIINKTKINEKNLKKKILELAEKPFINSKPNPQCCEGDPIVLSRNLYIKWIQNLSYTLPELTIRN